MCPETNEHNTHTVSTDSIPGRPLSWFVIAVGVVLIALGSVVTTGEISGLLGLWGISMIAVTLVIYGASALWYALG